MSVQGATGGTPGLLRDRVQRTLTGLSFAKRLVGSRGRITGREVALMRRAGFTQAEIAEILRRVRESLPEA